MNDNENERPRSPFPIPSPVPLGHGRSQSSSSLHERDRGLPNGESAMRCKTLITVINIVAVSYSVENLGFNVDVSWPNPKKLVLRAGKHVTFFKRRENEAVEKAGKHVACGKRRENELVVNVGKHVACSKRRENEPVAKAGNMGPVLNGGKTNGTSCRNRNWIETVNYCPS